MNIDTFEIVVMATLVVGFYIVCMRLSELHSLLRKLDRSTHGASEADVAMLAEIRQLVQSGKSVRAVRLYRSHFGATLAEAAGEVEHIRREASGG